MFVTKCYLSDLQPSVNDPFSLRQPLKCDCSEWRWAKPLDKVGVQRGKPISRALSETLREQDRLMRMNGGPPTPLASSLCIYSISISIFFPSVFIIFSVSLTVNKKLGNCFQLVYRFITDYSTALAGHLITFLYMLP